MKIYHEYPLVPVTPGNSPGEEDTFFMNLALAQGETAFEKGEVPVGAVIVQDGCILATGHNQREAHQDPTAHAELIAIRRAAATLGSWRLTGTTLYVTLEPCAMCAGAIIQARIARLVYGTRDPKAGACGSICDLTAETRFNHQVRVETGCLARESGRLLQTFFQQLRQPQPVTPTS